MSEGSPERAEAARIADLEAKVEELRRANAALGRQMRRGGASREPRSAAIAARALAKLTNERDNARAELDEARAKLAVAEERFMGLRLGFEGLELETERLRSEVARLRSGNLGFLRRARARLRRR